MKRLVNIDDLDSTGASRSKKSESQKLRWVRHREQQQQDGVVDGIRDSVLKDVLSQMYFIKWEDTELRDVWEVVTRLKKLGATI